MDFTDSKGVKLNPQTVWEKKLYNTTLTDTEIIGPFTNDCDISGCNYNGIPILEYIKYKNSGIINEFHKLSSKIAEAFQKVKK